MTGLTEHTIYPQFCFHLSPTVNRWCPLKAQQIHALDSHPGFEGKNVYFHLNHPIMWVKAVGIVVAIDEWSGCRIYTIDDSSGATIECAINIPKHPNALSSTTKADDAEAEESKATAAAVQTASTKEDKRPVVDSDDVDVGDCIQVTGCIMQAKWAKKIKVSKVTRLRSTADEVMFWNKVAEFYRDVLSQPWVLTEKEIRRCRRQAKEEPEETAGKQRVKEKKRRSRETGLKTKRLPKVTVSDLSGNAERRSTGLERTRRATGLHATGGRSNRNLKIEDTGATSSQTSDAIEEPISDTQTSKRLKRTGLEGTCKRPRTIQAGGTFDTSLNIMVHTTEEGLLEADATVAVKTRATRFESPSNRPRIVRTSTNMEGLREVPDEITALKTQIASGRRATGLERKSERPMKVREHEATVLNPEGEKSVKDSTRKPEMKAASHIKVTGLEPGSKRPRPGRPAGGSSTDVGKRAKGITAALDAVRTRVTGLERRSRRPAGTPVEGI